MRVVDQGSAQVFRQSVLFEGALPMTVGERFLNLHVNNVQSIVSTVGTAAVAIVRQTEIFTSNKFAIHVVVGLNVGKSNAWDVAVWLTKVTSKVRS